MKTVVAIHTATAMLGPTKELFAKHLPEVRLVNVVDESLIDDLVKANEVTSTMKKRLIGYFQSAVDMGADVIFNTCSSVGDVAVEARELVKVPLIKIDDAMAKEAVAKYSRIGVLATVPTTMGPTIRLIHFFANQLGKQVEVTEGLAKGAFQAVISGDKIRHDELVLEEARSIAVDVDVFVLAQGSMARAEKELSKLTGKPVLSSPERGVINLKQVLESNR